MVPPVSRAPTEPAINGDIRAEAPHCGFPPDIHASVSSTVLNNLVIGICVSDPTTFTGKRSSWLVISRPKATSHEGFPQRAAAWWPFIGVCRAPATMLGRGDGMLKRPPLGLPRQGFQEETVTGPETQSQAHSYS